jgi:hypothetical protein
MRDNRDISGVQSAAESQVAARKHRLDFSNGLDFVKI